MYKRIEPKKGSSSCNYLTYLAISVATTYFVLVGIVYVFQNKLAFNLGKSSEFHFPDSSFKEYWFPDGLNMTFSNITISSPVDESLNEFDMLYGWFVYHEGISHKIPTIVYFHENDYYPPARVYMIEKLFKNPQKYNVIMFDYRGYGLSTGKPTEDGLYNDCRAIMDFVLNDLEQIDPDQVYIFGASLGGAMATYSAMLYQDRVNGLILQNTIENAYETAVYHAPYLSLVFKLGLTIELPSIDRIKDINLPMMFIVGLNDTSTGPQQMYDLYEAAEKAPTKVLYKIPNCEHYLTWYYGGEEFDNQLSSFISGTSSAYLDSENDFEKQ